MKGVIIAGGSGSRLHPLTLACVKSLLPVGGWPMIYYPIKKLVGAGITDIMIVTSPEGIGPMGRLLGSGGRADGCEANITFRVQNKPAGIADALKLAEGFAAGGPVVAMLGDNLFQDKLDFRDIPTEVSAIAHLFLKEVTDPHRFGVATVSGHTVTSLEEKPIHPRSNLAATGLYLFPPNVFNVIRTLKPSARGELEITDVGRWYLDGDKLKASTLNGWWIDCGTPEALAKANKLVSERPPK